MNFIPLTDADRQTMLQAIGVTSIEDLFADVPSQHRFPTLDLPPALAELDLQQHIADLAGRNLNLAEYACFLGAGAYNHYIPPVVNHLIMRGEFYTAYTPYQPEVSQGTLTAIYEYQTMICQLTGMEVTNASMYDGSTALAEACLMAARITRRDKLVLARTIHPEYREVVRTYTQSLDLPSETIPYAASGRVDLDALAKLVDGQTACVAVQYPNFFGVVEDLAPIVDIAHKAGALVIVNADPIALGLLRAPGEFDVDIVVGEGQSISLPPYFGGPYLGLFATQMKHVRQLPGRVIGQTTDHDGRRAFVMTLQAREQHIRREKATSNICTNEALVALAATVYLASMGKTGLKRAAELSYHRAHYAAAEIARLPGYSLPFDGPFFKEFAVRTPAPVAEINQRLLGHKILGGYDLGQTYPELANTALLAVTEMNSRAQIDRLVGALQG
ncbi:MAG: aminomethyl-transferring glycine dehydrogenase subunit GcvPA [Anaerolineae bacterium]|nr:aminomethyl-transferring glycine dehydrogenase subunit GcvPA [Anaerolineae bacterium]